jgi:ATP-dependent DNA helicase RecG
MPKGRKPIKTYLQNDRNRLKVFGFLRNQIQAGRQVYIVYPLIEESEKLDLKHLFDGYESISRAFPEFKVSIVHGRQKTADKDLEMQRFVKGETQIMVSTTVIEVGINVRNATVMIIENAERFGLAQLHQLRGRVGRGADQSFCILMADSRISREARIRLETMTRTHNGFEIADIDLQLRGPGDIAGTQQSGALNLLIADLGSDGHILKSARQAAQEVLSEDPDLSAAKNQNIRSHIDSLGKEVINWSRVS